MTTPRRSFRKPTKTLSGVTPIAVALPPRSCDHGVCTYCPNLGVSQSYTPKSSTIARAVPVQYDPYKQIKIRLEAFEKMGQPIDKIELIVLGGTFLQYPIDYQYSFMKGCYDAMNGFVSKNLEEAKTANETAKNRCIAVCIETRPDNCTEKDVKRMLEFGATRCEMGVQAPDDKIYKLINRGHTANDIIDSTKRLKNAGFKVGFHLMPGLPGSSPSKDLEMFEMIFKNENFRPDQLKIYPTQILTGTILAKTYKKMKYLPYTDEQVIRLLIKMKQRIPKYCRLMRVMREIQSEYIVEGNSRLDLRKEAKEKMSKLGLRCNCIRCREIGFAVKNKMKIGKERGIKRLDYQASGGKEIFLEFSTKEGILYGICRLRIVGKTLFVRELHVYGAQVRIGEQGDIQHKGIGSALMRETESIAKEFKCKDIKIISGIGVREYYSSKFGYKLQGPYMVKNVLDKAF